ncbi:unnamed protein product [Rotaria sordida]|uniref:Hemimethylated DNA-binding domain-containing protein n=1 Tax=Rotaria sordida TaxID=392033 RepID=A0A819D6J1_9BILA|nr:unnamed protein product [Rotaria sordida]CAF1183505.1 unnamed protein product [Rotaria sordida]CAF1343372.1 unnamed protein product [Rotaria sordida]CAF1345710.1 unnamed protein product [Rotaria sordida]CAF1494689.1 unnamed protein product [Rotaria sordida]
MDRLALLQFGLLLLAVPLQYFILMKWSSKDIEQTQAITKITNQIKQVFHYLSPTTWFNWFISFVIEIPLGFNPLLHKRTWKRGMESPATEVYYMREKYGYFATSPAIRSSRSEYVKFRVGQVIRHKIYGYRAVIIGWDEIASAPDQWLDEHHQGHPEYRVQPNYSVLLDTRDRRAHKTYIPQEHIEVIQNSKIVNAQLSDYFSFFDGTQYIMQQWLQEQYPLD